MIPHYQKSANSWKSGRLPCAGQDVVFPPNHVVFLPANFSFGGNVYLDEGTELVLDGDLVVEAKKGGKGDGDEDGGKGKGGKHPHISPSSDVCRFVL